MFGISLPKFLNPVNQLKALGSVVGGGLKDLKEVAFLPAKELGHMAVFQKDLLTLNIKGAAREEVAGLKEPFKAAGNIASNDVSTVKSVAKNTI